jgi:uncharacterized protein YraI
MRTKTPNLTQSPFLDRVQVALRHLLTVGAIVTSAQVSAYSALTNADVNLRAGPDRGFPAVTALREQTPVEVMGCQSDYQWCDVKVDALRGWVRADYLTATYENTEVNVAERGSAIGLPVLAFFIGAYWADHYRDRPWYGRHSHWTNWHYHPRPPSWRPPHRPPGWRPPSAHRPPGWRPPQPRPPIAGPGVRPLPGGTKPRPHKPVQLPMKSNRQ